MAVKVIKPVVGQPIPIGGNLYHVAKVGTKTECEHAAKVARQNNKDLKLKSVLVRKTLGYWTTVVRKN